VNNLLALGGLTTAAAAGEESAAMMARIATEAVGHLFRAADADFFRQPPQGKLTLRVVPSGQVAHLKVDTFDDFIISLMEEVATECFA
jgi:hypothetical protein